MEFFIAKEVHVIEEWELRGEDRVHTPTMNAVSLMNRYKHFTDRMITCTCGLQDLNPNSFPVTTLIWQVVHAHQVEGAGRNDRRSTGRAAVRAPRLICSHLNGVTVAEVGGKHAAFYGHCIHTVHLFGCTWSFTAHDRSLLCEWGCGHLALQVHGHEDRKIKRCKLLNGWVSHWMSSRDSPCIFNTSVKTELHR